jgi:hypothetical protein
MRLDITVLEAQMASFLGRERCKDVKNEMSYAQLLRQTPELEPLREMILDRIYVESVGKDGKLIDFEKVEESKVPSILVVSNGRPPNPPISSSLTTPSERPSAMSNRVCWWGRTARREISPWCPSRKTGGGVNRVHLAMGIHFRNTRCGKCLVCCLWNSSNAKFPAGPAPIQDLLHRPSHQRTPPPPDHHGDI